MTRETKTFTVTGEQLAKMRVFDQQQLLSGMSSIDQRLARVASRRARILGAKAEIEERLERGKLDASKRKALRAKLKEFEASLENLERFKQEGPPTGNLPGVEIGAPLGVVLDRGPLTEGTA